MNNIYKIHVKCKGQLLFLNKKINYNKKAYILHFSMNFFNKRERFLYSMHKNPLLRILSSSVLSLTFLSPDLLRTESLLDIKKGHGNPKV